MKLLLKELLQLAIFVGLFTGYQLLYRNVPINGVVNNLAYLVMVALPPLLLFKREQLLVSAPLIVVSCILNVLVGFYILASVFHDGL